MSINVGDIVRWRQKYMKIVKTDNAGNVWGNSYPSLETAINGRINMRDSESFRGNDCILIKSADGKIVPEIERISKFSRREQIIYIANKYKDKILKHNFLRDGVDYPTVANELGMGDGELYLYFTYKLKINNLSNYFNEWLYHIWDGMTEAEKERKTREKESAFKTTAVFVVADVWRLLAYYCKYYSLQDAKHALSRFERLFNKKDWGRIKEMWTPLMYPDFDYGQSKFLVCKIIKKREGKDCVYEGELLDDGMAESITPKQKEQFLNRNCIIITKDKDKERIDYLIKQKSIVKIVGRKDKPYRNKTSNILKITTMRAR